MKKVVRTVWISLLSGLAFLVACTSPKGLSRAEKKQLKEERTAIINLIDKERQESKVVEDPGIMLSYCNSELSLRLRLNEINSLLGDKKATEDNDRQMGNLATEMDSLKAVIAANHEIPAVLYGPPIEDPVTGLRQQLDQLLQAIQRREGACVYGSPEIIQQYGEETRRMKQEAIELQKRINELENGSR